MLDSIAREDVSSIVALLSDVIEHRTMAVVELRRRFLTGLGQLINSPKWCWAHSVMDQEGRPAYFNAIFSDACTAEEVNLVTILSNEPRYLDDTRTAIAGAWGRAHFTVPRKIYHPDKFFDDPEHPIGRLKVFGLVDSMWSLYPLSKTGISGISFNRYRGEDVFTERELTIAHVVLAQVDWLHREGTNVAALDHMVELTLRQRAVLMHIMSGASAKQIAKRLELSEHTVRDHMKELHRVFNVQSRSELMAKFLSGKAGA